MDGPGIWRVVGKGRKTGSESPSENDQLEMRARKLSESSMLCRLR